MPNKIVNNLCQGFLAGCLSDHAQSQETRQPHPAGEFLRLDLARSLLRLGADPDIRDQRFDSTPLGWARHFGQEELVALLEPLTAPEEA